VIVAGIREVQLGQDAADVLSTVPSVTQSRWAIPALEPVSARISSNNDPAFNPVYRAP
jgi:hypothetical protein